jgi:ParB family chromosome partitioning protein
MWTRPGSNSALTSVVLMTPISGYGQSVRSGEYLAFLVANGYQLAEVERVIVGERTGDDVYDETLSAAEDTDPDSDEVEDTEPDTGDDPDSEQR